MFTREEFLHLISKREFYFIVIDVLSGYACTCVPKDNKNEMQRSWWLISIRKSVKIQGRSLLSKQVLECMSIIKECEMQTKKAPFDPGCLHVPGLLHSLNLNRLVTLHFDSKAISIYCHTGDFGCGDGAWTPVMKIDGSKVRF